MFLVDSSAWIEYLRQNGSPKVKARVREILQKEDAASCGVVVVEILRGAKNERDFRALSASLQSLPQLAIDAAAIERAARWGSVLDRRGRVVPTTDLLIAAAAFKRATLLHIDSDLDILASEFGLEQEKIV